MREPCRRERGAARPAARALVMEGSFGAAAERFRRYRELRPTSLTGRVRLARCLRELGGTSDAEELLEEVLRLRPAHPEAVHELARLRADEGRADEARELWERVLELCAEADPGFTKAEEARAGLAAL